MIYPLNPPLMELLLLSVISQEDSYGYLISQNLKNVSTLKDSALYPILKKLSDQAYVETYDQQYQGRNRKYYRITPTGENRRLELKSEWDNYCLEIGKIIDVSKKELIDEGGNNHD